MKQEALDNRDKINQIKRAMHSGDITYDEAKALAKPIIDAINAKSADIAKKYGKRPSKVSFMAIMR